MPGSNLPMRGKDLRTQPETEPIQSHLRKLIATRIQHSASLREHVEQFVGKRSEALILEYDLLDIALRRRIAEVLENRFTARIRDHEELLEPLTLLERDIDRARRVGDGTPELGDVVRNAWRLHEVVLRDIVARYRPPQNALDSLGNPLARQLGAWCVQLGMPFNEQAQVSFIRAGQIVAGFATPSGTKTPALLACALVSAAHGADDHPIRILAAARPHLLTELTNLSKDRNDGTHAHAVPLNREYGETAWRLANDTTAAYLGLPVSASTTWCGKDVDTDVESA